MFCIEPQSHSKLGSRGQQLNKIVQNSPFVTWNVWYWFWRASSLDLSLSQNCSCQQYFPAHTVRPGVCAWKEVCYCKGNCCATGARGRRYTTSEIGNAVQVRLATAKKKKERKKKRKERKVCWNMADIITLQEIMFLLCVSWEKLSAHNGNNSSTEKSSGAPYPRILFFPWDLLLCFAELLRRVICVNWQQLMTQSVNSERRGGGIKLGKLLQWHN